jgi:hypothetical protein
MTMPDSTTPPPDPTSKSPATQHDWRRQVRIDKMATLIYATMLKGVERDYEFAAANAVRQAILLAAAVDKALGIP